MVFDKKTKNLLIIGGIIALLYLLYKQPSAPSKKTSDVEPLDNTYMDLDMNSSDDSSADSDASNKINNTIPYSGYAVNPGHSNPSYAKGNRKQTDGGWSEQLDNSNDVLANNVDSNNDYTGVTSALSGAPFSSNGKQTCGSNQDCPAEDLYNIDNYLPGKSDDSFFETVEPVSVKNRYLINVAKPIGVNTIGSSRRNSAKDLRGTPITPKQVVSPFLNSSIDPDTNITPMC